MVQTVEPGPVGVPVPPPAAPIPPLRRWLFTGAGLASVALGVIGLFLPIMPTVPFMLLAAFCFARGNPAWEARLLAHPQVGPPIRAWREQGAIGRTAKIAALLCFAGSAIGGFVLLPRPWCFVPLAIGVIAGAWIATRPTPR